MPSDNRFQHQVYTNARPAAPYRLIHPDSLPVVGSDEFLGRMRAVGDVLRAENIAAIYLVHGTFVGNDASGMWSELSRVLPSAAATFRQLSKKGVDSLVGEHGSYTPQFARLFEESINSADLQRIPVCLFDWSSENHHLGRADAAVRLLSKIHDLEKPERVLLWGHSHGGNVFALMSNLLGGDEQSIDSFFEAARVWFRSSRTRRHDLAVWQETWQRLKCEHTGAADTKYDFVTFGTPIRYGWETNGYAGLLHFTNHRPTPGLPEYLARFPLSPESVLQAIDGDCVQQLGIAGTNVAPNVMSWRCFWADRRLNALLQPNLRARELHNRLKLGMRVPAEGTTLLVDYGPGDSNFAKHHAGHAVYTHSNWLLFHAEQTVAALYDASGSPNSS